MLTMQKMVSTRPTIQQAERQDSLNCFLGFDIGGTKIRGALADQNGLILAEERIPTAAHTANTINRVINLCDSLLAKAERSREDLSAAVVGVPGVHDQAADTIRDIPNVPELAVPGAIDTLSRRLGIPIAVENDANLAALGEWVAFGKPAGSLATLALGTGIGLGVVIEGSILRGDHGAAGEIASLPVGEQAFVHKSRDGILESVVSTAGLLRLYEAAGGRAMAKNGADIFDAVRMGDKSAESAAQQYCREVARAVLSTKAVIDPGRIVLTGGIGSEPLLRPLVAAWVERSGVSAGFLVDSILGERAGIVGAVQLALGVAEPDHAYSR